MKRSILVTEKLRTKQQFAKLPNMLWQIIRICFFCVSLSTYLLAVDNPSYSALAAKTYAPPFKGANQQALPQHAKPLVILDAGHGGSDEGAKVGQFLEKKLTLITVMSLKKYLDEMGYRVILTRSRDVYIPLPRRVSLANRTGAATSLTASHKVIFVSIHYNASHSTEAKGIEIFYPANREGWRATASKNLAAAILPHIVSQTHSLSRGVKAGNFHVIRETEMPAVLVEGGFITNCEERACLRDRGYLDRISKGIATGIDQYFKRA
jgi:N-acetylmuramoyl-L-alanine amidase